MNIKKLTLPFVLAVALSTVVSGGAFAQGDQQPDLEIPVLVGQTGASALFGQGELRGYTLAVDEWNARGGVNGRKVVLRVEDTQTSQRSIFSAYNLLASSNPPVILGPTWLDTYQGIVKSARQKGILLVTPSAEVRAFDAATREWAVTFYYNTTLEIHSLLDYLSSHKFSKVGVIYEEEPFSALVVKIANEYRKPAIEIGVQGGESDFQAIVTKIKALNLDALLLLIWDERSLLALLKQLKTVVPKLQLVTIHDGEGWLSNESFKPYLTGLIYSKFEVHDTEFVNRFTQKFQTPPILTHSNAYDAMNAVLSALAHGAKSGAEIRNYILSNELQTVTFGAVRFDSMGGLPANVEVVTAK